MSLGDFWSQKRLSENGKRKQRLTENESNPGKFKSDRLIFFLQKAVQTINFEK